MSDLEKDVIYTTMEMSTRESSSADTSTDMVCTAITTAQSTKVILRMGFHMDEVLSCFQMVHGMKDSTRKAKNTVMERIVGQMVGNIVDNGDKISRMDMEY